MKYQSTSKPDLIRQTEQLLCNGKTGREQPHWPLIAIVTTCCALAGSVFGASLVATVELSALDGSNGFIINGKETHGSGSSVSSAGDVNADGVGDLLVGAPYAAPNGIASGQSHVIFLRRLRS